jgi:quercetin dioxygenase-like cupin family protein
METAPPDPWQAAESQESLARFPWPRPSDPQIRVEHRLAEGDPAEEILRLCETVHSDLVVMGTHGKTGLGRFLTGSVAEEVLRKGTCPVLVVKTPLRGTPEPEAIARPGDLIDVRPLGAELLSAHTRTLVRGTSAEVVRLIVLAGQEVPQGQSEHETIVHCLEGRVAFTALGKTRELAAGNLLILPAREPSGFKGIEDSSLLLTILDPRG